MFFGLEVGAEVTILVACVSYNCSLNGCRRAAKSLVQVFTRRCFSLGSFLGKASVSSGVMHLLQAWQQKV